MRNLLIYFILFTSTFSTAQEYNPNFGEEYVQDFLPSIEVTMNESAYDWMMHSDNIWSSDYQHATVIYKGSDGIEVSYLDLGIRLRGNTSRGKNKKSFKLHFEKYTDDQYFFGLKKLNLKAETNDPSAVREHITMNLFRESNIPVARVNHIKLYINSNYMGLYSNIEQVDKRFLTSRFDNKSGNLYKCVYGADLADIDKVYDDNIYELETNEDENNRSNLSEFITFLSSSSDKEFEDNVETYVNVPDYIKQLSIEVLTGHWDGYSYNNNNFYLYYNPDKSWFEFIPYDTDNTFGIDWIDRDWTKRNIYDWAKHGDAKRPLHTRILNIEKYAQMYSQNIDKLIKNKFNVEYQMNIANTYKNLISNAIYSDTYYSLDFGYSTKTFEDSYTKNANNHAKYGIEPFIEKRVLYATNQLNQSHLAISDNLFSSSISTYPIPLILDKKLNISTDIDGLSSINISILNSNGQEIFKQSLRINKTGSIDLSSFKAGVYILLIEDAVNSKMASKKLIIN